MHSDGYKKAHWAHWHLNNMARDKTRSGQRGQRRRVGTRSGSVAAIRLTGNPWLFDDLMRFTPEGSFLAIISLARILEGQGMPPEERVAAVQRLRAYNTTEEKLSFVFGFAACTAYLCELSQMDEEAFSQEFLRAAEDYNARDPSERG